MKYYFKSLEVEAVQYKKDCGLEDGFTVHETDYPEDGYTFQLTDDIDTTRMTIICGAVRTPIWQSVSEGEWIVRYPTGRTEIWKDREFQARFISSEQSVKNHDLQSLVLEQMYQNSMKTGFESVSTHALGVILNRYTELLFTIEKLKADGHV